MNLLRIDKKTNISLIVCTILLITSLHIYPVMCEGIGVVAGTGSDQLYMGIFFGLIPLTMAVLPFAHSIITGEIKHMLIVFTVLFLPYVFIPQISGYILLPAFLIEGTVVGIVGIFLHILIADKIKRINNAKY